jgi:16S rRNA (cytosine1402-N4)-methyltransferase
VHIPDLLTEVLELLAPRSGGRYVDATIDGGGHARAVLEASAPDGRVLGLDRDPAILDALRSSMAETIAAGRLQTAQASFAELDRVLPAHGIAPVDGVLFDLGLSSFHLDASGRGFSFARDEPLDMRFDASDADLDTAADILASRSADELTELLRTYGEERFASRIARTIVARRRTAPLRTTAELLAAIEQSLPPQVRWRATRDAARVFQALRIAANDELGAITAALPHALAALAPRGRLVVIAFHSLEDRLVKTFFRERQRTGELRILTRKPLQASAAEIAANPRAASAKLRAAERI